MHRIDGEGATADGKFTEGNPTTGVPATTVTADWCNAVQDEIINVLLEAGIEPTKSNSAQLVAAIKSLIAGGGVSVTATGVSVADVGNFFATKNVEAALQQLAEKIYNGVFKSNQIRREVQILSGTSFQTEATHAENILSLNGSTAITYTVRPDSELNLPVGTCIHISQHFTGQVTIAAGGSVGLLRSAGYNLKTLNQHAIIVLIKKGANTWWVTGGLEPTT